MKKITHIKIVALLLLAFTFVAQAQNKKIIFNNGQETDIQGNATININTGDITVMPVTDKLIVDEPASQEAIIGFYPSKYAINQGESIAVNWAVAYTDPGSSCTASVTQGSAAWSGNKNAGPGVYVQTIVTVSQLPATLRLTCANYNSGSTYQEFNLVLANNNGNTQAPNITAFYVQGQSSTNNPQIPSDGPYQIYWSVQNATSCTASSSPTQAGWNASTSLNVPGGSYQTVNIVGSPILTLNCENNGTPGTPRTLTFTNTGGGGNPSCAQVDVWSPPGLTAVNFNYTHPYKGGTPVQKSVPGVNGFGGHFYQPDNAGKQMVNFIKPEQEYLTISNMQVPNEELDVKFSFGESTGWGEQGPTTFSVSECQGNFNPSTARCVGTIFANNILLSTRAVVANSNYGNSSNFCYLEKGKNYYINFVFSQPYDGTNFNNILIGEECTNTNGNGCSIMWGEKGWSVPL